MVIRGIIFNRFLRVVLDAVNGVLIVSFESMSFCGFADTTIVYEVPSWRLKDWSQRTVAAKQYVRFMDVSVYQTE